MKRNKTKHTPEPWSWSGVGDDRMILDADRRPVLTVDIDADRRDPQLRPTIVRDHNAAPGLAEALEKAVERMEAVAEGIPVHNRAKGVSQAAHVAHMAGHLAQHAKKARAALAAAEVTV